MLRTYNEKPQLSVSVNNVPSKCASDCSFEWKSEATPVVDSIDTTNIDAIKIYGSGFDSRTLENNVVLIGEVRCSVLTVTDSLISCKAGSNSIGTFGFSVVVLGKGKAVMNSDTTIEFGMSVEGFSPQSGSSWGGNFLRVNGYGFSENTRVMLDGNECIVVNATFRWVDCIVPKNVSILVIF